MHVLISALFAAVLCIMPALASKKAAAEGRAAMAPAGQDFDWSGGYIGAQLGGATADQGIDLLFLGPPVSVQKSWSPSPAGVAGGIFAGYNWQLGANVVFGVEAEYNWAGADGGDRLQRTLQSGRLFVETIDTEIERTAAVRGRLGYAIDRTLLYVAGGWAWIDHQGVYTPILDGIAGARQTWSRHDHGWTLGLGAEHAFTPKWVGRIDYRYSNFGEIEYHRPSATNIYAGDLETHDIRAGIALRF